MINYLLESVDEKEILYINLDDPFFIKYQNNPTIFYEIIQQAKKLTSKDIKYIFIDEIQNIDGWERYIKSAYDSDEFKKIFITGSNSSLLSSDLATLLSGRYISTQVFPLKFKEILKIVGIRSYLELNQNLPKVLNIIDDMMRYGSFVEVYQAPKELKREILKSYYETILLKDCIFNNQIRDAKGFRELSFYLLTNATALYSYHALSKALKLNDKSIKEYISYLEDAYMIEELKLFSFSLKEQQNNKKKIYVADNGFFELGFSFSSNSGKLLENLVFNELQKSGFEIYFYNKNFECDFICKKDDKLTALQVCYELNNQNRQRELNGLKKLPFKDIEKKIITYNQNEVIDDIEVVSFWEYFGEFGD